MDKSDKEQLIRYENRLKDVVAAYKSLSKEKEALEAVLSTYKEEKGKNQNESVQIQALMNSVATLSAEKSRMEQSFQADKKQLRHELQEKDKILKEALDKLHNMTAQQNLEFENYKSKLIVERHNQEKQQNSSLLMIRELQKLLADERHLKENLEMQLNDLKTQFSKTSNVDKTIKELSEELDHAKKRLKQFESNGTKDINKSLFDALQTEIGNLKQQHKIAIENEQKKAISLSERNKRLSEIHEERVATLEARLAELSSIVGSYHRLRVDDQECINKLKEKLSQLEQNQETTAIATTAGTEKTAETKSRNFDVKKIIDEVLYLKYLLIEENAKLSEPIDLSTIFAIETKNEPDKLLENLRRELDNRIEESKKMQKVLNEKSSHINNLQEKINVLNKTIEEIETDSRTRESEYNLKFKKEKEKWQQMLAAQEIEFRSKISQLEQELQNQRVRSLSLLEDKENEIKTMKTFYESFIPKCQEMNLRSDTNHIENDVRDSNSAHLNLVLNATESSNCSRTSEVHIIHYSNELARKDLELGNVRKAKREAEDLFRKALKEKVMLKEEMDEKIFLMEQEINRLQKFKSREGANLEYLKNVFLNFLNAENECKIHMLKAIAAVLKFDNEELRTAVSRFPQAKKSKG